MMKSNFMSNENPFSDTNYAPGIDPKVVEAAQLKVKTEIDNKKKQLDEKKPANPLNQLKNLKN